MNLNNKKFVTKENEKGLASGQTLFHYQEDDAVISATYGGGKVERGSILGKRNENDEVELLYHCLTKDGDLLAGEAKGVILLNEDGLLEIKLDWNWLNGGKTGGKSHYIELE